MIFKVKKSQDKEAVKSYIDKLPDGKRYNVTIVQHREKRSVDQNRLYWLWLSCISGETGEDKDSLHDYFKQWILGFEQRAVFSGQAFSRNIFTENTTTKLDTKQFTDYLEKIQQFANIELGIILPNPEDQYWDQFYEQYKNKL